MCDDTKKKTVKPTSALNQNDTDISNKVIQCKKIRKSAEAKVGLEIETTLAVRLKKRKKIEMAGKVYPEQEIIETAQDKNIKRIIRLMHSINDNKDTVKELEKAHNQELEKAHNKELKKAHNKELEEAHNKEFKKAHNKELKTCLSLLKGLKIDDNIRGPVLACLQGKGDTKTVLKCIGALQHSFLKFKCLVDRVVLYEGKGWKAVHEKVPVVLAAYTEGYLYTSQGVEIVTDAIENPKEAALIMEDIEGWLEQLGTSMSFSDDFYIYEIPRKISSRFLKDGKLIGNIQVNIGSTLEDVIDVFQTNAPDCNDVSDKKFLKEILNDYASDSFWDDVKTKFDDLGLKKTNAKSGMSFFKKKSKKPKQEVTHYEIETSDEPYLRNIMFQYIYQSFALKRKLTDKSCNKNRYPILIKTSVATQTILSNWHGRVDKWGEYGKLNENHRAFRAKFAEAIEKTAIEKNSGKKISEIQSILEIIKGSKKDNIFFHKYDFAQKEELKIADQRYAGVFEIRYLQNASYKQSEWLGIWATYLSDDMMPLNRIEQRKKIDKKKYNTEHLNDFFVTLNDKEENNKSV